MAEYGESNGAKEYAKSSAAGRYRELASKRQPYLDEMRACAELTNPRLMPPGDITDDGSELATCAQSDGAKCINGLATKITLGEVPPNVPVIRFETGEAVEAIMDSQAQDPEVKAKLDKAARETRKNLDSIARETLKATAIHGHRPKIYEGNKHLVCGGNILFWFLDDKRSYGKMRAVPLSRYVVQRDSLSFPLEVIIRDGLSAANLPPKLKEMLNSAQSPLQILQDASAVKSDSAEIDYALYTYACWDPEAEKYKFHQCFMDKIVEGSEALYSIDDFPLCPLRFNSGDGEDYGRGHVSEYRGVLMAVEALAQAETASAIAMSEFRLLVGSGSTARARDIMQSPPGQPLDAEPNSIVALSYGKAGDLAGISAVKRILQRDLAIAFLDNMAVQRDAERVTAEEFRTLTLQLDMTLGGLHATLASDFLPQYARFLMRILRKEQRLTVDQHKALGDGEAARPRIVTGLDALGRNYEAQQFFEAQRAIVELITPQEFAKRVNVDALADKVNAYYGIETKGLYKSQEQVAQEQSDERLAQSNLAALPHVLSGATEIAKSQNNAA